MMANPLRECYKRGKRWCGRRLANLGKEREYDTQEERGEIVIGKEARYLVQDSTGNTQKGIRFKLGHKLLHLGC